MTKIKIRKSMKLEIILPPEASRSPNKSIGRSFWVYKNHKDKCAKWLSEWEAKQTFTSNAGSDNNFLGIAKAKFVTRELDLWKECVKRDQPFIELTIIGHGCRPKDPDNLVSGCKAIIDQLRYAGYLIDDNPTALTIVVESAKVAHRKDEKLILQLETIESEKEGN